MLTRDVKSSNLKPAQARTEQLDMCRDMLFDQLDTTRVFEDDTPFSIGKSPVNYYFKSNSNMKNARGMNSQKANQSPIPTPNLKLGLLSQKTNFDSNETINLKITSQDLKTSQSEYPQKNRMLKTHNTIEFESSFQNKYLKTEESNWSYGDEDIMDLL